MAEVERIILFGGQGSRLFGASTVSGLDRALLQSPKASLFLSKCHGAFLFLIESLDESSDFALGLEVSDFSTAQSLLNPREQYKQHGVVQSMALFTGQLIQFISSVESTPSDLSSFLYEVSETSGFCAGLLPAIAISSASSTNHLVDIGVELFKLSFWIAYRSWAHSIRSLKDIGDTRSTWSLVVANCSEEEILTAVNTFQEEVGRDTVQIAAISTGSNISLSGPPSDLETFGNFLPPSADLSHPFINTWYHGGNNLTEVLAVVELDIKRQNLRIPRPSDLRIPIRSTFDGHIISKDTPSVCLGTWVARHMLIESIQWKNVAKGILENCLQRLEISQKLKISVESFGPGSSFLLANFKPSLHPRLHLVDHRLAPQPDGASDDQDGSIAIVGMSLNLPGADCVDELADMLSNGVSAVGDIPQDRFNASQFRSAQDSPGKRQMEARHGAFLNDIWAFDNNFFSISPREAVSMDPQQRLLLHTVQSALDDAGYVPDSTPSYRRSSTGCFIGLATGDYTDNLRDDIDVFYSPGTLRAFHSGRISYFYKLSGPCMTIDTACSSSLVAIHQACRALQAGDCTSAIVGGANVICSPDMYLGLDKGHFLSATGGCKPFDAGADGYCRAEGVVVFILKRLKDALAENDHIHGIIRDVVVNQSGNSKSITHPHSPTQIDLLNSLLERTKTRSDTVGVIEAHGTGTQAGDSRELESLAQVFSSGRAGHAPLFVSSIKGNIGHCEAASGAAGLAKLLLMMKNKCIYKQVGLTKKNSKIPELNESFIKIPCETDVWRQSASHPRRAILNNFGAAGSNGALLLEEWIPATKPDATNIDRSAYVFALSAKSREALQESIERHIKHLERSDLVLRDVCYTATARRARHDFSVAIQASSVTDLLQKLRKTSITKRSQGSRDSGCVFTFSGQGAMYAAAGQELMATSKKFRDCILYCDEILTSLNFPSITPYILGQGLEELTCSDEIIASQCACVALQYAIAQLLISWGVEPKCVVGYSLGEYAAFAVCGALPIESAMKIVAQRAELMTLRCIVGESGMTAVKLSMKNINTLLREDRNLMHLEVCCVNGREDHVLAGPVAELELLEAKCRANSTKVKRLDVPFAFHSSAMDPILAELEELSSSLPWSTPSIPLFSTALGRLVDTGKQDIGSATKYLSLHARQPVLLAKTIAAIESDVLFQDTPYLEIGPHPITLPMIRCTNVSQNYLGLASLQKTKQPWVSLCNTLCTMIEKTAINVNWRELFASSGAAPTNLPGYPLDGKTYSVLYKEPSHIMSSIESKTGDLEMASSIFSGRRVTENGTVLRTSTDVIGPLIVGHNVGGVSICPASVFWALATEGARLAFNLTMENSESLFESMDFKYTSPLIHLPGQKGRRLEVFISQQDSQMVSTFTIKSDETDAARVEYCSGRIGTVSRSPCTQDWKKKAAIAKRQMLYIQSTNTTSLSRFQTRLLYDMVFPRVVQYSTEYQSLSDFCVAYETLEGFGSFRLPRDSKTCLEVDSSIRWTDVMFHAAGFIANTSTSPDDIYICAETERVIIDTAAIDFDATFTIYCSLLTIAPDVISADAYAITDGQVVASCEGMHFKRVKKRSFQQALNSAQMISMPTSTAGVGNELLGCTKLADVVQRASEKFCQPQTQPQTMPDQKILEIISEVSGVETSQLRMNSTLEETGIDSMMQIEIAQKFKRSFLVDQLDHDVLANCNSLYDVVDLLLRKVQASVEVQDDNTVSDTPSASSSDADQRSQSSCSSRTEDGSFEASLTTLQVSSKNRAPLILFPDGSGIIKPYARLECLDRNVHAVFDSNLGDSQADRSVESVQSIARAYASMIMSAIKPQPIILGGWSFGGVVALETAHQLHLLGQEIQGLVLIDSPCPVEHDPLPSAVVEYVLGTGRRDSDGKVSPMLRQQFRHAADMLSRYTPPTAPLPAGCRAAMLCSADTLDTLGLCDVEYPWLSDQDVRRRTAAQWDDVLNTQVEMLDIPGNHFEVFDHPNISKVTEQLHAACRYIEKD